jgi:hypothetical protein
MQHLTKYTFSEYNYSIIEYNGEHYIKDIYSFQMKEGEPLKIDLLENENNYSNIFENSEDVFNFKDSNISAYQNFLQINDNFDSEKELEIHSRENSDKKDINSFKEQIDYDSSNDQCLFLLNLTNSSLKESRKNTKKIFDVIYPEKSNFDFNRSENTKRIIFIKRRRRDKKDNILQKIKRAFFNTYLYNRINNLLKIGKKSHKFFYRFSKKFIIDMVKKNNKKLLDMTLRQIIENESKEGNKQNLNVLSSLKEEKNDKLEELLNSKYRDIFEAYINSKEFDNEIIQLKAKDMTDSYIKNYIYLSKNFIKFFEGDNEI